MSDKIKAKVLDYNIMDWGIYCGRAKLKLLEGEDKGKTITMPVADHYKKGQTIEIYGVTWATFGYSEKDDEGVDK
jgi:hypothetical protein